MTQIELEERDLEKVDKLIKSGIFFSTENAIKELIESLLEISEDDLKKIHKDFVKDFKFAKIFNSTKFSGKRVGLDYKLQDNDIVEIHIK